MNESPCCTKSSLLIGMQDCQFLSSAELLVGRDPGKNGLKIRMGCWRKRSGQGLVFGSPASSPCPLLAFREVSSYCSPPKLHSYSLPPQMIICFIITAAQFVTEQLASRKKSELIKLTHYRFNLEINKMQASEKNRMSYFYFSQNRRVNHRVIWVGRDLKIIWFQPPPAMGRDSFH